MKLRRRKLHDWNDFDDTSILFHNGILVFCHDDKIATAQFACTLHDRVDFALASLFGLNSVSIKHLYCIKKVVFYAVQIK